MLCVFLQPERRRGGEAPEDSLAYQGNAAGALDEMAQRGKSCLHTRGLAMYGVLRTEYKYNMLILRNAEYCTVHTLYFCTPYRTE